MNNREYLGRGWTFPPEFSKAAKAVNMLEEDEDIRSSLHILFSTRLGERVMQPNYGCNLDDMIFEAMNLTMTTYLRDIVETAILYHEPRINLEEVKVDSSQQNAGLFFIEIIYIVRTTNSRMNFVYPYYINEGTNI